MAEAFVNEILSWQVDDIVNEKRFHLDSIPKVFDSQSTWKRTFPPFVLEENRAQLHQITENKELGRLVSINDFFVKSSPLVLSFPEETRTKSVKGLRDVGAYSLALVVQSSNRGGGATSKIQPSSH